ncbi:MAG: cytochrome c biogenesis protein [Verrucomicrobiota bacterium]
MKKLLKIMPWFLLAIFVTEIVAVMLPKSEGAFHVAEFGRLPVLLNGRIQPFDSVARNALLQIRSTGDLPLEQVPSWQFWHHPKKLKSTEWLLEVAFRPDVADTRPIFLIHHPDLISELKLDQKGIEKSGLRYYTFKELEPVLPEIIKQGQQAEAVEEAQRTAYQKQTVKLTRAVMLYHQLKNSIQPEGMTDFAATVADFQKAIPAGLAAFRAQQAGQPVDQAALERFTHPAGVFQQMANLDNALIVPPLNPEKNRNAWQTTGTSLLAGIQSAEIHPAVVFFARMASAFTHDDAAEFNSAVAGYKNWLAPNFKSELTKGRAEFYFNQVKVFLHATIIYIVAFVLAGGALLTFGVWPSVSESLRRASFGLILLALVIHTFGLIFRMVLEGRPPVTNLYSSAIFVGWGACLLGLVLERIYKVGLGSAVAGLTGLVTLLIAHNLALGGDTMEMMRAVLDTNFWLATHVVVVTLGYSSTFVAGLLAIAYLVLGIFTPLLSSKIGGSGSGSNASDLGKALAKMVYAIICFAALFSFLGTVLGGIWADQSWGRFWGWDPKENGALLIVIWNAAILHARWGGIVRERGIMNMAIFGNIVTGFSWFGVNMLGVGLHSYGFMDAAFKWLMLFIGTQVALILLGCLPLRLWKSFQAGALPKRVAAAGKRDRIAEAELIP